MADIISFRAITYDTRLAGLMDDLVAPPYDVIDPDEQVRLYDLSPYNCVRLILNRDETGDDPERDRYARAATTFSEWLAAGMLREMETPALWLYRQEFASIDGHARYTRTGIFCALHVEPYERGVVLPHEQTRSHAKEDRLRLTRALDANPEPIYALYEDPAGAATARIEAMAAQSPAIRATVNGDVHALWPVVDPDVIAAFEAYIRERRLWIADGHHRYETALRYSEERRAAGAPAGSPSDYVLTVLTRFDDPGLLVLPTHRLVRNVPAERLTGLRKTLASHFAIEPVSPDVLAERMAPAPSASHRFGLLDSEGAAVLTLADPDAMVTAAPEHAPAWRDLDVSILQTLVLDQALGIPAASLATTPDVAYTRDASEARSQVASGAYQAALLLNASSSEDVRRVAAAGEKMPPKSTFFYPKLWSGLLMRRLST
jgi:uncharacterized protein (DUF1015 family)